MEKFLKNGYEKIWEPFYIKLMSKIRNQFLMFEKCGYLDKKFVESRTVYKFVQFNDKLQTASFFRQWRDSWSERIDAFCQFASVAGSV